MTVEVSLLEVLACRMGCEYVSDLRFLPCGGRERLALEVERIQPQEATLLEWNDALSYLTGAGPEETAERARASLAALLRRCGMGS